MEPYDTKFCQDPEKFGREYAFHPEYGEGAALKVDSVEARGNYKVDSTQQDFPVLRAIGRCRVAHATIVPDGKVKNAYLMKVYAEPAKGRFPIYWLPYDLSGNHSSMIKLKPSKKLDDESPGHDSPLFVTDALTGCTITIAGTAEEPVVYHSPQVDKGLRGAVTSFHEGYEARKKQAPRPVGHWGNDDYGAYFPDLEYKGRSGFDLLDLEQQRFTRHTGAKKGSLKLQEGATVFGRRVDGAWQIYCQESIQYSYDWFFSSYEEKKVRRCYPIWPPGIDAPQRATVFVGRTLLKQ